VVVVGSGAGGSIVTANLAAKGKKVIVLDKGQYFKNEDNTQREQEMIAKTFEAQGLMTSKDGGMSILAGSNVGGGTSINWAGCLRAPDWILEEWAKDYNNPQFLDPEYLKGFDAIELRNSINANLPHNPQNKMLGQAGEQSNFTPSYIPQNFKKEPSLDADIQTKAMGFSCIGDYYGLKQSATQTFLADACANGADIIANTHIENIIIKNNKAVGVKGKCGKFNVEIKAEKVVIASGALHTPTILLRSGLQHQEIGRNLYLHPVSPVPALYDARIEPWHGAMMTTVIKDFERLEGNYGFKLECPPVHPGLAGTVLNWVNGEDFKSKMLELPNLGIFFPLVRDKKGGQVRLSPKSKLPEIQYIISDYDKKHLVKGIQECVKLHITAGAKRINIIHNDNLEFFPDKDNLQAFLKSIENAKWRSNSFGLFSAHQMGTCRMGGNADSPVKPNGETREVQNLFIADTSLFPSASGVNPMLSAQALAWYVSQQI
jgi:choline dehydrogenase-like flavoprotein